MAKTKFASEPLLVWCPFTKDEILFWFDGNGKITAENGTFANPAVNAFSLLNIDDCPHRTPICEKNCYVNRLKENEPDAYEKYEQNSRAIRHVLSSPYSTDITVDVFAEWISTHCQKGGFRWHVSGDIFSREYAWFIRKVAYKSSVIRHWIYTRSFYFSETLYGLPNLAVNLSADRDNWNDALACHARFGFRICFMVTEGDVIPDLPEGSVIFPSHELRGRDLESPTDALWWKSLSLKQKHMVCPPDFFGQSEVLRCGPCNKCLL